MILPTLYLSMILETANMTMMMIADISTIMKTSLITNTMSNMEVLQVKVQLRENPPFHMGDWMSKYQKLASAASTMMVMNKHEMVHYNLKVQI